MKIIEIFLLKYLLKKNFNMLIIEVELRKNRYKLIYSNKMKTKRLNYKNKLPMKNFKLKDRINYTSNLLYKRF